MKSSLLRRIFCLICLICLFFGGLTFAQVAHVEDSNIVGAISTTGRAVCFNNDGNVVDESECDQSPVDEGLAFVNPSLGGWSGGTFSEIYLCGTSAVNPVSTSTCDIAGPSGYYETCVSNGYALYRTFTSGHYFALKADASCNQIATPEISGIVPCRKTDSFDPVLGCRDLNGAPQISIEGGYIKLDTTGGGSPPVADCAEDAHEGRMVFDETANNLYICGQSGWTSVTLTDL